MAYRRKGARTRSYRPARRSGRPASRRTAGARRGYSARGGGVLKLVIQQAPAQTAYSPGVPGTVGVAALGPKGRSPF